MSDERVARVELYHFSAPLPKPFHPSWIPGYPQTHNRATIVKIVTTSGVEGWSAGPAISKERSGLGELIGPYLIGEKATDLELIQQRCREIGYLGWRNWWIEPAFWDIKAKLAGCSVARLLSDDPASEVDVYASSGEVRSPADRVAEAHARAEEGFDTIKIRVHEDEAADIAQVKDTARELGDRMRIGVDANQAWRVTAVADAPLWDLARAKRFVDVCADAGVAWVEEPLPMDAYDDLSELTAYSRVPVAGGELHTSALPELKMMIERRCYSIFQPDATFTGGIAQTWAIAQLCKEHDLGYTPHTWTNGIGFAINLQLMAASGFASRFKLEYPIDPPGWVPQARDAMLTEPFLQKNGKLAVPQRPGLGFEIDPVALKKYGTRFFAMDRKRLAWFAIRDRGLGVARQMDKTKRARIKNASK